MHLNITDYKDFPDDTMKQVWYSNCLGNRILICVKPKRNSLWYEVEFKSDGVKVCYDFRIALRYANGQFESLINP